MNLKLSHLCLVIYLRTLSDAMTVGYQIKEAFADIVLDKESFLHTDEHGTVVNCGSSNMSLTWTPKTINSKGTLTIDGYAQFQTVKGQFTIKDLSALSSIHGSIEVKILLYNSSGTQLFCGIVNANVN